MCVPASLWMQVVVHSLSSNLSMPCVMQNHADPACMTVCVGAHSFVCIRAYRTQMYPDSIPSGSGDHADPTDGLEDDWDIEDPPLTLQ